MTVQLSRIKSLIVAAESTFSTSPITTLTGSTRVPAEVMVFTPTEEFIARAAQNDALVTESGLLGGKGGTLTFKTDLVGAGSIGGSGQSAGAYGWMDRLLSSAGLSGQAGTGSSVTSATTTAITVTSASGFVKGSVCALMLSGKLEVRRITDITGSVVTVSPAFSGTAAASDVLYAPMVYVPIDNDPGTVSFVAKGDGYEYTFTGCKAATPKLSNVTAKGRPQLEWSYQIDSWTRTSTSGTLPALSPPDGVLALGAPFFLGTSATSTPISEFSFDPGSTLVAKASTEGTEGRSGWVITDRKPVASCKPYFASTLQTQFEQLVEQAFIFQMGTVTGRAFAVFAEAAQISKYPGEADIGGNVGHDLMLQVDAPTVFATPWAYAMF